jgi:AcrR family transcriptional regulator
MSMEGIAERAGVGKTTIYRRWTSKEAVALAAIGSLKARFVLPDTGETRRDLVDLLYQFHQLANDRLLSPSMIHVAGVAIRNPDLLGLFWERVVGPRRAAIAEVLRRGIARGDVRADVDPDLVTDMIAGRMLYQVFFVSLLGPPPESLVIEMIDTLWRGISDPELRSMEM